MSAQISPQLRSFMTDTVRIAKIATVRKDGGPWVQPVWHLLDGNDVIFNFSGRSLLARCIKRELRAALCVDDVVVPYAFAVLEGPIELTEGYEASSPWMKQMIRRFRPDIPDVEKYVRELGDEFAPILGRMKVEKIYYEPVVSPPPPADKVSEQ
jgi:hypothetical protein